jgi:hypothetical protein
LLFLSRNTAARRCPAAHRPTNAHRLTAARQAGRDPAEIRRSVQMRIDPDAVIKEVKPWIAQGFTEIVLFVGPEQPLADLEKIAARLPELRG